MNLSPEQKRALIRDVDMSNAEQVFDAVAAALAMASPLPQPTAWARPDELERLAAPDISGRSCYLSTQKQDRCTVPLYRAAPDERGPGREPVLAALRHALAGTRAAASMLEDVQFRGGMEAACDEIEARLSLAQAPGAAEG